MNFKTQKSNVRSIITLVQSVEIWSVRLKVMQQLLTQHLTALTIGHKGAWHTTAGSEMIRETQRLHKQNLSSGLKSPSRHAFTRQENGTFESHARANDPAFLGTPIGHDGTWPTTSGQNMALTRIADCVDSAIRVASRIPSTCQSHFRFA